MTVFSSLSARLQETFRRLRGKGKLTEKDVDECLREVRVALLEADVNFKVVRDFLARVRQRAVGSEVLESLTPAQQVVKIVHEELTALMGAEHRGIAPAHKPPTAVLLVGLQGSGKTTTAAKLGMLLRKQGRRPCLVAADTARPAAIEQLGTLARESGLPFFQMGTQADPVEITKTAVSWALSRGSDFVVVDTAGRLHVDDEMMEQVARVKAAASQAAGRCEVLLVVDAMTGQDAVNAALAFESRVGIDGVVLTKLDGDARGGAALSVRAVTGKPIKFVGVGERTEALEPFHPDRMASRILGMGDVLTLIEKAEAAIDEKRARELEAKIRKATFTLEDFLDQLKQVRKMGPLDQILGMIPGLGRAAAALPAGATVDEKDLSRMEAMINSMTPGERRDPSVIDGSRRRRIARGSGTTVQDVNILLKRFVEAQRMMKTLAQRLGPGQSLDLVSGLGPAGPKVSGKGIKGRQDGLPPF